MRQLALLSPPPSRSSSPAPRLTFPLSRPAALALIRNIQKLSGTALVADAFILIGLIYIFGNEIKVLVDHGAADVVLFNGKDFPLLIGCVCSRSRPAHRLAAAGARPRRASC